MSSVPKWITPTVKQMWACLPIVINKICLGMTLGYASSILVALKDPKSGIQMDVEDYSWYVSLLGISFLVTDLPSLCLMARLGRRKTMMIYSAPALLGLIIMIFNNNLTSLKVVRFLSGLSMAAYGSACGIIIGEYTSPQLRSMLLNLTTAAYNIGSLVVHLLGHFMGWKMLQILILLPYIASCLIAYTMPESPSWLAERKKYEKSREAFYWLRGRKEDATREIEELIRAQRHRTINKTARESIVDFFLKFKTRNFLKPTLIILVSVVVMEGSGRHIMPSCAAQLVENVISADLNPMYVTAAMDALVSVSSVAAAYLITVLKMRTLLFSSGSLTFLMISLTSLSLYGLDSDYLSSSFSWAPVSLFALYLFFSNLICTTLPIILGGEIFPLEHKVFGTIVNYYAQASIMTIALKFVPMLIAAYSVYVAFALLAVSLAATLLILYFILPETTKKTLQEIEDYFSDGRRNGDVIPSADSMAEDVGRVLSKNECG